MTQAIQQQDDADRLRQFKAEFFKALGASAADPHPGALGARAPERDPAPGGDRGPASSLSQQLAVLRGRNVLATERRGTTIIYRVPDPELFELLDVARRIFNAHLSDTVDLLRLVEDEGTSVGEPLASTRSR